VPKETLSAAKKRKSPNAVKFARSSNAGPALGWSIS
jgi:hypothetical protein